MNKSSPQIRKLLVTFILTLFVLSAFVISGFTISTMDYQAGWQLPPSEGPVSGGVDTLPNTGAGDDEEEAGGNGPTPLTPTNVIINGDFEKPWETDDGVAPDWEGFHNGQAQLGWYEKLWPEAVYRGERAQLMEIFLVEPNILDRVIAIYQTAKVAPNASYDLTLYAIMRSQVQAGDRNKHEFEMSWGIDFLGEGNYDNVEEWHMMPLEEQFRLGSTGEYPEDIPLFYEMITGTVSTGDSNKITLFIRGLKKFSTGAEVNFDIDDVSLMGPPPGPVVIITPEATAEEEDSLPNSGAILPKNISGGALIFGGLVLVVLGAVATTSLLQNRKET
jgi:hypothetical protein